MKIQGTKEAFLRMLGERGVYKKIGVSRSTANNWKRALIGDDPNNIPTVNRMEDALNQYGAVVISEKIWKLPDSKSNFTMIQLSNVLVELEVPKNILYNAEVPVSYYDEGWRNAGVAHLKRQGHSLYADIKLFKDISYKLTYPKTAIDNELLHSVLLLNKKENVHEKVKPLGHKAYRK